MWNKTGNILLYNTMFVSKSKTNLRIHQIQRFAIYFTEKIQTPPFGDLKNFQTFYLIWGQFIINKNIGQVGKINLTREHGSQT